MFSQLLHNLKCYLIWIQYYDYYITKIGIMYHKIGSSGDVLARKELLQAQFGCHVIVGCFIAHTPPHIHNLYGNTRTRGW